MSNQDNASKIDGHFMASMFPFFPATCPPHLNETRAALFHPFILPEATPAAV
jgi:hypothetical protein